MRFWFAALLVAAPVAARADLPDEIQVYDDSLDAPGAFGVELHVNHSFGGNRTPGYPGEITTGDGTRLTGEFSYGLSKHFEAGLYLDFAVAPGGTAYFAGPKLRLKWIGRAAPDGGVFYGLNVELGYLSHRFDRGHPGGELRPILGWRSRDWLAIINPSIEFSLGAHAEEKTPEFAPGIKLGRRVADGVMAGVEAYRGFGPFGNFSAVRDQGTQVFAVIDVTKGPLPFNFGVGRGFGGAEKWAVKAIFQLPF